MSKRLLAFRGAQVRAIARPWVKSGGVWGAVAKVYRRESYNGGDASSIFEGPVSDGGDASTIFEGPVSDGGDASTIFEGPWVEWWPLLPYPPVSVTGVFLYRNDNIELDIDWEEAVGGPPVDHYRISVFADGRGWEWTQVGNATFTTPGTWQHLAGKTAVITVSGVSEFGDVGPGTDSPSYVVPYLPAPPDPSSVAVAIVNRGAVATWIHAGGNRLSSFELRTSYQSNTRNSVATKDARSKDVTFWSTAASPGDPGGVVGFLVRAVGPGGYSNWVGASGAVPNVPNPPPPPASPPTQVAAIPGSVQITNHRFLNGVLRCDYSAPGAASVNIWWERNGASRISVAGQGASGSISIAASSGWARDDINQYRIVVQGVNSAGAGGTTSAGSWCRKLPNPYVLVPNAFVSMRGVKPDEGLGAFNLRQGASYNQYNYKSPIIIWRGYVGYPKDRLAPSRIGYGVSVTAAEIWMQRNTSGGSGSARPPRLWWHGYASPTPSNIPGTSLFGGATLSPLNRGQAAWLGISKGYAAQLVDPNNGVKGVATYHEDQILRSYLGEVSESYIIMNGPFAAPFGQACFSIRIYHDG